MKNIKIRCVKCRELKKPCKCCMAKSPYCQECFNLKFKNKEEYFDLVTNKFNT